jgi:predicted nucleic acid-binding Zn ribbon protein
MTDQFKRLTSALDERQKRIRNAVNKGGSCAGCGRELGNDEAVGRARIFFGRGFFGRWRNVVAPFCGQCLEQHLQRAYGRGVCATGKCEGCGRTVHETERRWHARHHFCSDACRRKHESQRSAAIARQRRAEARGPSRQCVVCNEAFEPARADARYCSPACKQKAHRDRYRVTLNEMSVPDRHFVSRNAVSLSADAAGTDQG